MLVLPQGPAVAVYQVPDTRKGCPPRAAANAALIQKDFSVTVTSTVLARAHMIRIINSNADLYLSVDGREKDRTRTYTRRRNWQDGAVFWVGQVAAGKHSVKVYSNRANAWGCQTELGDLDLLVLHQGQRQPSSPVCPSCFPPNVSALEMGMCFAHAADILLPTKTVCGFHTHAGGGDACVGCAAGRYSIAGSVRCTACAVGRYAGAAAPRGSRWTPGQARRPATATIASPGTTL